MLTSKDIHNSELLTKEYGSGRNQPGYIRPYIRSRLHQIAVEHERLKQDVELKRIAWQETNFKVDGVEFTELNAAISAMARYEAENGINEEK